MFPLLTFGLRSVLLMLWVVLGLVCFIKKRQISISINKKHLCFLFISILPFIYLTATLIYTDNYEMGTKRLIQMMPLFVFPIIFYLNSETFNKKKIKNILYFFSVSVVLLILYQLTYTLLHLDYFLADLTKEEIVRNNLIDYKQIPENTINIIKVRRFRNLMVDLTDTHPTYQGLWIALALFVFVKETFNKKMESKFLQIIFLLISFGLVSWLFIMATRMPIVTVLLAFILTFLIFKKTKLKTKIGVFFLTVFLMSFGYFVSESIQVRVKEVFKNGIELPTNDGNVDKYNSTNVRNGIYFCSLSIIKDNLLFGVGVGDSQDKLNECYKVKIGAKIYTWSNFNTHNQYLYFLLASGLIGFILFIIQNVIYFKLAIRKRYDVFFYTILVICLISITENILSRSDGVMFFSLFCSLFIFNLRQKE
ncbi:O-antigen ligase family protein [Algibacter lectus]|uniref:O-antigen ligase family protein n=2 Tax=Algibacter lectus TaxID=221126 RepID=UPI0026F24DB2|nr:O-antigen ligase family protein [Algibacter lectus]